MTVKKTSSAAKELQLLIGLVACVCLSNCTRQGGMLTYDTSADSKDSESQGDTKADEIEEPTMVGGAFLYCAEDSSISADSGKVGTGCAIKAKNTDGSISRVKLNRDNIKASLALYDPLNKSIASTSSDAPEADTKYHWYMQAPEDEMGGANVALQLTHVPTNTTSSGVTTVDMPTNAAKAPITTFNYLFGQSNDIFVGDIAQGISKECIASRQDDVAHGSVVQVPFQVLEDDTTVGITIAEICSVADPGSTASVYQDANKITSKEFDRGKTMMLDGFTVKKGLYNLKFKMRDGKNVDNFLVGQILFRSDKEITVGAAYAPTSGSTTETPSTNGGTNTDQPVLTADKNLQKSTGQVNVQQDSIGIGSANP